MTEWCFIAKGRTAAPPSAPEPSTAFTTADDFFWAGIRAYDGEAIADCRLAGDECIRGLKLTEDSSKLRAAIANTSGNFRTETAASDAAESVVAENLTAHRIAGRF